MMDKTCDVLSVNVVSQITRDLQLRVKILDALAVLGKLLCHLYY